MKARARLALALLTVCVACKANNDSAAVVTPNGFGPVRVGASVAQLSASVGTAIPAARSPDDMNCRYVMLSALPLGMRIMMIRDTVARIDVDAAGPRTAEGAGVGDQESRVVDLYRGRVVVQPHKYTGPVGHYVIASPATDTLHRTVFETDGQKILRYRAGVRSAVDLVEGCG